MRTFHGPAECNDQRTVEGTVRNRTTADIRVTDRDVCSRRDPLKDYLDSGDRPRTVTKDLGVFVLLYGVPIWVTGFRGLCTWTCSRRLVVRRKQDDPKFEFLVVSRVRPHPLWSHRVVWSTILHQVWVLVRTVTLESRPSRGSQLKSQGRVMSIPLTPFCFLRARFSQGAK